MSTDRPPRCRPLPSHVVEAVAAQDLGVSPPELLDRLERALAALPPAERAAVVRRVVARDHADG